MAITQQRMLDLIQAAQTPIELIQDLVKRVKNVERDPHYEELNQRILNKDYEKALELSQRLNRGLRSMILELINFEFMQAFSVMERERLHFNANKKRNDIHCLTQKNKRQTEKSIFLDDLLTNDPDYIEPPKSDSLKRIEESFHAWQEQDRIDRLRQAGASQNYLNTQLTPQPNQLNANGRIVKDVNLTGMDHTQSRINVEKFDKEIRENKESFLPPRIESSNSC